MLTKLNNYTSGSDWGDPDLYEPRVFHTRFEYDAPIPFEFRIGKGSNIYSIITPAGELIGTQRVDDAEWVDGVFQCTMVDQRRNRDSEPYFIHQAGAYQRDPERRHFYSPIIAEDWDTENNTYRTICRPQQAHVPSVHRNDYTIEQKLRALGDGVIEVTWVLRNFGYDQITFSSFPYCGIRESAVPNAIISHSDGTISQENSQTWGSAESTGLIEPADTDGWCGWCTEPFGSDAMTLGVIFGLDKHWPNPGLQRGQYRPSRWRWGKVTNPDRDLQVGTVQRHIQLSPGDAWFMRFYVALNTLYKVRCLANDLKYSVDYGYITPAESLRDFTI